MCRNIPTYYAATGLISGLSINTTIELICGAPIQAGSTSMLITVGNSGGADTDVVVSATNGGGTAGVPVRFTITPAVPVINSVTTRSGVVGVGITHRIAAPTHRHLMVQSDRLQV